MISGLNANERGNGIMERKAYIECVLSKRRGDHGARSKSLEIIVHIIEIEI